MTARTTILTASHVAAVVGAVGLGRFLDELIRDLDTELRAFDPVASVVLVRAGFHYQKPDVGLLEWMPAMVREETVTIKTVGYHPTNPLRRNLPSVLSTTARYDTTSGQLRALADSTMLTALRTGAASAVATDVLADTRPLRVGMVGCGAQAVAQLHALSRVRELREVLAFDIDREASASFAARLGSLGVPVRVVDIDHHHELLEHIDVLCTCTSVGIGEGPVVLDAPHASWLHVNAIGADFAGKLELPRALLERSLVVPDSREQCVAEGECQQLRSDQIGPSLADLVNHRDRYETYRSHPTVFDSTGWALEDHVALDTLLRHALRLGIGDEVELTHLPTDPLDPFGGLQHDAGHRRCPDASTTPDASTVATPR